MYYFIDFLDLKWQRNVTKVDLKCTMLNNEPERNFYLMHLICASVRNSLRKKNHIFNYDILGGENNELGCKSLKIMVKFLILGCLQI